MAPQLQLTFGVTNAFFDRPAIQRAVSRAKKKNLGKAGAFIRRYARSSIKPARKETVGGGKRDKRGRYLTGRKRNAISRPGQPPRYHVKGKRNIRLILFAWDANSESVVVGPVRFQSGIAKNAPSLLEHGGTTRVKPRRRRRRGGRSAARPAYTARYRPRPFMFPALKNEAPKFPELWKDTVHK